MSTTWSEHGAFSLEPSESGPASLSPCLLRKWGIKINIPDESFGASIDLAGPDEGMRSAESSKSPRATAAKEKSQEWVYAGRAGLYRQVTGGSGIRSKNKKYKPP